jgi:hypothetical protein
MLCIGGAENPILELTVAQHLPRITVQECPKVRSNSYLRSHLFSNVLSDGVKNTFGMLVYIYGLVHLIILSVEGI